MKGKKFFLLSLVFAIIAAGVVFNYLTEIEKQSKSAANLVPVYVANAEIPARTKIDASMFSVIEISKDAVHLDAVTDKAVLLGSYTQERVIAGEQILASRLAVEKGKAGLSYQVSEGHRAVTLPVNNVTGVAGYILPGDFVDAIVTIDPSEGNERQNIITTVVANKIRVLASGEYTYEQDSELLVVETVTLDVPVDSVTALIQASERGSLRLVLRPVGDGNDKAIRAHRINQFLPQNQVQTQQLSQVNP